MENSKIDFGQVIARIITLLIVKPFTLPFKIYRNTLESLSNSADKTSSESALDREFPLYVWSVGLYDAIIALIYPLGFISAVIATYGAKDYYTGEYDWQVFITMLISTYFLPLVFGLLKELLSITLKMLLYLKIISKQ
ncbi:MAG: hypothetical protein P8N96_06350 [Schleiferiaceae bacterium]|jgi:hypothetical protein|nr:hypothetical protein [Flavobacteriales bacterium]MDG1006436.1 hypothetical protein [Schleiferiaceae bacterium]MDO7613550.1 hypothetical protein [Crocinitomicaceae bacterium]MDO7565991.1 hypothetical protein [Schleiferiaceae bacterium]MDO7583076.1 hypothetical protein [Schleiferiaceae bacterium]